MIEKQDVIADLVRAAGRRRDPPYRDRELVFAAASDAWRAAVRGRRKRQTLWAAAAASAVLSIMLLLNQKANDPAVLAPFGTVASIQGELSILEPQSADWRPLHAGDSLGAGVRLRSGQTASAMLVSGVGSIRLRGLTAMAFAGREHIRLETGTVYVDTDRELQPSAAPTKGVSIESSLGVVRDVGTIFEVAASPKTLEVRVREGRVVLGTEDHGPFVEAAAGEELRVQANGAIERRRVDITGSDWTWAERLATPFNPEGRPLSDFLRWVARETGRRLRFRSASDEALAKSAVLHGKAQNLPPMEALEVMLAATDFEYSLQPDSLLVIGRRAPPR